MIWYKGLLYVSAESPDQHKERTGRCPKGMHASPMSKSQKCEKIGFVYHASPNSNIDKFTPKTFAHNKDLTESGRWDDDKEPPKGMKKSKLVYAGRKDHIPFYSLPRNSPRITITDKEDVKTMGPDILKMHPDLKLGKKNIFVNAKDRDKLKKHSFTVYKMKGDEFHHYPQTDEYVSKKEHKPVSKKTHTDAERFLKKKGFTVHYVPSVQRLGKYLSKKGHGFNAEGVDI